MSSNICPSSPTESPLKKVKDYDEVPSSPTEKNRSDIHPLLKPFEFRPFSISFENPLGIALYHIGAEAMCGGKLPVELTKDAHFHSTNSSAAPDFGSMHKPNIEALLSFTNPSSFGKGDQTVYDESIRKGLEIRADQFTIDNEESFLNAIKEQISEKLFPGMINISFQRYKMAIYQEGGHFDFHRDTMHSVNHQATLLIEVCSAHQGGTFVIDYDGTHVSFTFTNNKTDTITPLSWLAFYTDAKHKVESVTSGTRIVIQYDVYAEPDTIQPIEADESWGDSEYDVDCPPQLRTRKVSKEFRFPTPSATGIFSVLYELKRTLPEIGDAIAIPLFHLYQSTTIKAQYLKNTDRQLLIAILSTGQYEVGLSPVTVSAESNWNDGMYCNHNECQYQGYLTEPMTLAYVGFTKSQKSEKVGNFHVKEIFSNHPLNNISDLEMVLTNREHTIVLDSSNYIEHCGNEPSPAMYRYFHGAMIVRRTAAGDSK